MVFSIYHVNLIESTNILKHAHVTTRPLNPGSQYKQKPDLILAEQTQKNTARAVVDAP